MRIVFIGTPEFAVPSLEELCRSAYEVCAVFTQPDRPKGRGKKLQASPVKEKALAEGLPVYQPAKIKALEAVQQLRDLKPDVIVVVAFGQLLSQEILDLPPLGCINVHSSLLPAYRGAAPMQWAVINGEKKTGVSTMFMDKGMDTGDILLQAELPIGAVDTFGQVHDRLAEMGASLLLQTLRLAEKGQLQRLPQNDVLSSTAPLLKKEDELIDWRRSAAAIANHIRGMNPQPGAYTTWQGKVLKIWLATAGPGPEPLAAAAISQPGEVVFSDPKKGLLVQTGDGQLQILELQLQGGKHLSYGDFLRGNRLTAGTLLGISEA